MFVKLEKQETGDVQNRVLTKVSGHERDEIAEGWSHIYAIFMVKMAMKKSTYNHSSFCELIAITFTTNSKCQNFDCQLPNEESQIFIIPLHLWTLKFNIGKESR
jgi:hypothetical protein